MSNLRDVLLEYITGDMMVSGMQCIFKKTREETGKFFALVSDEGQGFILSSSTFPEFSVMVCKVLQFKSLTPVDFLTNKIP